MEVDTSILNHIAHQANEYTVEDLNNALAIQLSNIKSKDNLADIILQQIQKLLTDLEAASIIQRKQYANSNLKNPAYYGIIDKEQEIYTQEIYDHFFYIQNLINLYIDQAIIITHVIKNEDGTRSVVISDNVTDELNFYTKAIERPHYSTAASTKTLISGLKEQELRILQATANEIDDRYDNHIIGSKQGAYVMWKPNKHWEKYKLFTKGPINEAFINFYVNNVPLHGSNGEQYIDDFMLNESYGAQLADSVPGFIQGDVSVNGLQNGLQFAVKGEGGKAQGIKEVLLDWYKYMVNTKEGLSAEQLKDFIENYKNNKGKEVHSQIIEVAKVSSKNAFKNIDISGFQKKIDDIIKI